MTHQPPIPDAATSPYPLHPAPIPEEQKIAAAEAAEAAAAEKAAPEPEFAISKTTIGVGAAIGLGAAAAVGGLIYARRRAADAAPKRASKPKAAAKPRAKPATSGDKKQNRASDRARVAGGEPYEVAYFARKHKISAADARAIIKEAGPSREAANALAKKRKDA